MKTMKPLLAALLLVSLPGIARANGWEVDRSATQIGFTVTVAGTEVAVTFSEYEIDIAFDPDDLGTARVELNIDTSSAQSGQGQVDDAMSQAKWFNTADFPQARFISSGFRSTGEGSYEMDGTLSVKDASMKITVPFTLAIDGPQAHAQGEVALVRTDYGLGTGDDAQGAVGVGLDVTFSFDIAASSK